MESCDWVYAGSDNLTNTIDNILQKKRIDKIYICCYHVNIEGQMPFLEYLLHKTTGDKLAFPTIDATIQDTIHAICATSAYLHDNIIKTSTESGRSVIFKGFRLFRDELYIFYHSTRRDFTSSFEFCLIDEIMNTLLVYRYHIDDTVTRLFLNNYSLLFLTDKSGVCYETPVAGYIVCEPSRIISVCGFGPNKARGDMMFGEYYYFTTDGISGSGSVKFALFIGKCLVKQNLIDDPRDTSAVRKYIIDNCLFSCKRDYLTSRITDYDGTWADNYDSVYLGHLELDDGMVWNKNMIVVKEYGQFTRLSVNVST